jgi:hypothetical protein
MHACNVNTPAIPVTVLYIRSIIFNVIFLSILLIIFSIILLIILLVSSLVILVVDLVHNNDDLREAYRTRPASTLLEKPDIVMMGIYNVQHPGGRRLTSINLKWDVLWVKCKGPSYSKPSGWHMVLGEAAKPLARQRSGWRQGILTSDRKGALNLAIGLKWMPFLWDPFCHLPARQTLQMLKENSQLWSDITPYIRPFPMANQQHTITVATDPVQVPSPGDVVRPLALRELWTQHDQRKDTRDRVGR